MPPVLTQERLGYATVINTLPVTWSNEGWEILIANLRDLEAGWKHTDRLVRVFPESNHSEPEDLPSVGVIQTPGSPDVKKRKAELGSGATFTASWENASRDAVQSSADRLQLL